LVSPNKPLSPQLHSSRLHFKWSETAHVSGLHVHFLCHVIITDRMKLSHLPDSPCHIPLRPSHKDISDANKQRIAFLLCTHLQFLSAMPSPPRPTPPAPSPGSFVCYPPSSYVSYTPNVSLVDHVRLSDYPGMELVLYNDRHGSKPNNETSSAQQDVGSVTSTWRAEPGDSRLLPPSSTPLYGPPYLPYQAVTQSGTHFIVHYICQECQRPRSVKYHNEHPVHPGSYPPISSICHRCQNITENRVIEIDGSETFPETTTEKESSLQGTSEKVTKSVKRKSKKKYFKIRASHQHTY